MSGQNFELSVDAFGHLILRDADGVQHRGVQVVRAFPISAPDEGLSLVSADGHELVWLESLNELAEATRKLVAQALHAREFMPEIKALHAVSTFATPSEWRVNTDRGKSTFILKGEEDIRRISDGVLLVADSHGVQYLIRDLYGMDRHSRKLLDRFL